MRTSRSRVPVSPSSRLTFTDAQHVVANVTVDSTAPHGARDCHRDQPGQRGRRLVHGLLQHRAGADDHLGDAQREGSGHDWAACPFASTDPDHDQGQQLQRQLRRDVYPGQLERHHQRGHCELHHQSRLNTLLVSVSVASNATPGLRDVTVTNPAPSGAVTKAGAFTVNAKARRLQVPARPRWVREPPQGRSPSTAAASRTRPTSASRSASPSPRFHRRHRLEPHYGRGHVAPRTAAAGRDIIFVTTSMAVQAVLGLLHRQRGPAVTSISRAPGLPACSCDGHDRGLRLRRRVRALIAPARRLTLDQLTASTTPAIISVRVDRGLGAAPGARDVKVTNPDGGVGTRALAPSPWWPHRR